MSSPPKVLVAGATGYLGKHLVRALHAAGFPVRALARAESRLGDVRPLCAEVVIAQATKPETLGDLLGDATVLVSALGKHDFRRSPTAWEVDHRANLNLIEAAQDQGLERVVFVSVLNGPKLRDRGISSVAAREAVVDAVLDSGLASIIVRPSGFFNDMADFFNMARKGTGWLIGDGEVRFNPIHGADLADFIVGRMQEPQAWGRSFEVGGPDLLTFKEIMALAFEALDKPVKTRRVPDWLLDRAPGAVALFNPFVADLIRSITVMCREGASAPPHGTHHLRDFYAELAAAALISK